MPKVSVIIPVYNAFEDVKLCLESIVSNFNFELGEVCVINDCSDTETTDFLRAFSKDNTNIRVFENDENLGFVKTCNQGMRLAKGDIVVLLNSDTKIPLEFCERIIKCFEFDNEIGIASPISSCTPNFYIRMPENYSLEKMNKLLRSKHECTYPLIHASEGFCFCIRKEVIEQQGYFDEIYGKGYNEEVDYAYRAITNGWKNVLIDDLYVYHKRQASFGTETRKELMKQNHPVLRERWAGFREKYEIENNIINPVIQIEQEMFPNRRPNSCIRKPIEYIFSLKNSNNKKFKIITIAGIQIKMKWKSLEQRLQNIEINNKIKETNKKIKQMNNKLSSQNRLIKDLKSRIEIFEKKMISESPLWNAEYYIRTSGHDFATKQEALNYWYENGCDENENPSPYIDIEYTKNCLKTNSNPLLLFSIPYNYKLKAEKNYYKSNNDDIKIQEYLEYKRTRKAKNVVYTCITDDYDDIEEISTYNYIDKDWDYVCFTDNEEHIKRGNIGIWEIRPLQYTDSDNIRNQRWHKTHPHIIFKDYEKSIWVDANINILTDKLFNIVNSTKEDFIVCDHFERVCIYKEFDAVLKLNLDNTNIINKQLEFIKSEGMPQNYGLAETNILYRNHSQNIINLMEEWWEMIKNYSKRDQLSFTYILWKNGITLENKRIMNSKTDYKNFLVFKHVKRRTEVSEDIKEKENILETIN